jgi:bacterioferritin-associated ferredoxin
MKPIEKAIREFCGHHADWWPSTTQVQEMLALAQPCPTCEALARTVMLDQTSHDTKRPWVGLTDDEIKEIIGPWGDTPIKGYTRKLFDQIEAKLKEKNGG